MALEGVATEGGGTGCKALALLEELKWRESSSMGKSVVTLGVAVVASGKNGFSMSSEDFVRSLIPRA